MNSKMISTYSNVLGGLRGLGLCCNTHPAEGTAGHLDGVAKVRAIFAVLLSFFNDSRQVRNNALKGCMVSKMRVRVPTWCQSLPQRQLCLLFQIVKFAIKDMLSCDYTWKRVLDERVEWVEHVIACDAERVFRQQCLPQICNESGETLSLCGG